MASIGVDLGGTNIRAGIREGDVIVKREQISLVEKDSLESTLRQLTGLIRPLVSREISGIGIAVPSIVDSVNGIVYDVVNIPSYQMKAGDVITIKEGSKERTFITSVVRGKNPKFSWLDWNETELKGTFITYPERESVPENIKEQLIVELYSK